MHPEAVHGTRDRKEDCAEPAWKDEEDEKLRSKFKMGNIATPWAEGGGEYTLQTGGSKRQRRGGYVHIDKKIFGCKFPIRKIVAWDTRLVVSDASSSVYIIDNVHVPTRRVAVVSLGRFNLVDFVVFAEKIVCVSSRTHVLKEIDVKKVDSAMCTEVDSRRAGAAAEISMPAGVAVDVRKSTGEAGYRKILAGGNIYVLGAFLTLLDSRSYEVLHRFAERIVDVSISRDCAYCLAENGDILVYGGRRMVKKVRLDDKFSYRKVFGAGMLYVAAGEYVKVFDMSVSFLCEKKCGFEVASLFEGKGFIVAVGEHEHSIRLFAKPGYAGVPNFPSPGVAFPRIVSLTFIGERVYFCHGRYISAAGLPQQES